MNKKKKKKKMREIKKQKIIIKNMKFTHSDA